jgi:O-antigen/teichoic acid export membrane protein
MAKMKNAVMAGCLDERTSLHFILIMNFILSGFYYAFAGLEAMKYSVITGALTAAVSLCGISGFAFSEAAFTASAAARNDYKTVLYVRFVSCLFSFGLTALFAIILIAAGRPLAAFMLGEGALAEDITHVYAMMIMIAVYALISCYVFWLRGFWQGAQQSAVDTRSQLIFCGSFYILAFMLTVILVYGFHINRALSAYGLCGALILARLLCLGYYVLFDRLRLKRFKAMAKAQILPAMQKKKVFSGMIGFTAPSLTLAICASVYMISFAAGTLRIGEMLKSSASQLNGFYGAAGWMIPMMTLIPMIFSDSAFESRASLITRANLPKEKKSAAGERMMVRYLVYALGFSFLLGCLAPQLINLFYGNDFPYDLINVLRIQSAEGLLGGLCVLSARFMMIKGLGNSAMAYGIISAALRIGLMIVMPVRFGLDGILYSGIAVLCVFLFLSLNKLADRKAFSFVKVLIMTVRILLACLAMNGVYAIFKFFGIDGLSGEILFDVLIIGAMAVSGALVYMFILSISGIPLGTKKKRKKKTADDQTG